MSENAKQLFEGLRSNKDVARDASPGLGKMVAEIKAELGRLGTQGAMEAASALFNGDAFVPYGPGNIRRSIPMSRRWGGIGSSD